MSRPRPSRYIWVTSKQAASGPGVRPRLRYFVRETNGRGHIINFWRCRSKAHAEAVAKALRAAHGLPPDCLCDEIHPSDRPCLVCLATEALAAEVTCSVMVRK